MPDEDENGVVKGSPTNKMSVIGAIVAIIIFFAMILKTMVRT